MFVFIPLADFINHVDTLNSPPWEGAYQYDRNIIQSCIEQDLLDARPWDHGDDCFQDDLDSDDPLYHAKRVAFLAVNKCHIPISIDVGVPSLGFSPRFLIQDGCHRLAAAIYRADPEIPVDFAGSVSEFKSMFPRRRKPTKKERFFHEKA